MQEIEIPTHLKIEVIKYNYLKLVIMLRNYIPRES